MHGGGDPRPGAGGAEAAQLVAIAHDAQLVDANLQPDHPRTQGRDQSELHHPRIQRPALLQSYAGKSKNSCIIDNY